MIKILFTGIVLFFSGSAFSQDSFLTLKQQLDRLQREVSDLSKSVFQKSSVSENNENGQSINFAAIDLRIYDLEKDIKNLTMSFEELSFQLEELNIKIDEFQKIYQEMNLSIDSIKKIEKSEIVSDSNLISDSSSLNASDTLSENTLGTLKINTENLSNNEEISDDNIIDSNKSLSPEEQYQLAYDLLRNQQFDEAKQTLMDFISKNEDNKFAGSAHYWLGEIYLLNQEYREAALILAEGYQKYPGSIKAPDILYKLSITLIGLDKNSDACDTLNKFSKEYSDHKLYSKTQEKISELECSLSVE